MLWSTTSKVICLSYSSWVLILNLNRSYEIHQKKLGTMKKDLEMKKQGKLKVINEKEELLKMRVISNKLKNHEFQDNEKILEIQKQNQKLMCKLYEISQGKNSTMKQLLGFNPVSPQAQVNGSILPP